MQVEQKRACGSCGSENAPDAGFCWRCLVPFAPGADVRARSRPPEERPAPAPLPWSPVPQQQESNKASKPSKVVKTIVSLIAAAAGYFGVQFVMGPSLSLPDSVWPAPSG